MRQVARCIPLLPLISLFACGPAPEPSFRYRGSVEQVHVWKAPAGAAVLLERDGASVAQGVADEQGSLVFRKVAPAEGYVVRVGEEESPGIKVMSVAGSAPDPSFYKAQKLVPGFQYVTMRDGTKLSTYVTFPGPEEDGPFPTVVNYSGYNPSEPGYKLGDYDLLCPSIPVLCDAPHAEGSLFAATLGYATVNVNIRGTGCSGGAYDYFETLQQLDGYDVIEIAAAQDWVLHRKVGMEGLSYPGITQLFVGKMRPPGLAAITPLSVIGNTVTTLVPGGILNDGFALQWVEHVLNKARPWGQNWEKHRVDTANDRICEENQLLHSQRVDNVEQARRTPYYIPEMVDPINPEKWVGDIEVPVFIAGAWQDEQTGPFFAILLDRFTKAPALRATVQNGVHPDAYAPAIFPEWAAFLDLFVAKRVPRIPQLTRSMLAPQFFKEVFDVDLELPADRWSGYATYEDALAAWMAEPKVRMLFESGAGGPSGAPVAAFERKYPAWPPHESVRRWHLAPGGALQAQAPTDAFAASEFAHDPAAGQRVILPPEKDCWDRAPEYEWTQPGAGSAAVFETAALEANLAMGGTGSVDLWIRSTATEADLEVNLSEVRPDGKEMYVQSGWLRASQRKLSAAATELYPDATHLEADAQPLVPGEWTFARVAIAPFAHVFRAGSRIRLSVDTPGDSRVLWRFALAPVPAGTKIAVGHDQAHPSSVALPVLPDAEVPALPPCTVRGQQCRTYQAFANVAASP